MITLKEVLSHVNDVGAVLIIILMVYKSPAIINSATTMVEKIITHIRETQQQALKSFEGEVDKMLTMFSEKFLGLEKVLEANMRIQTDLVSEMKTLGLRLKNLEDAKPTT